jgi:hypothetical protein
MKRAVAAVGVIWATSAALLAASPHAGEALGSSGRALLFTVLAQILPRAISRFGIGYPSRRGGDHPPRYGRLAAVLGAALLAASVVPGEVAFYLILVGAGVALAHWCRSSERSPVYFAAALSVLVSIVTVWRPGTSITWAAARLVVWLPLYTSITWASWHVVAERGAWDRR